MVLYNKLFAGTYLYLMQVENRGAISFSSYFAYSTLLALTFFHMLFLGGLVVALKQPQLILNVWVNISVGLVIFLNGWFFFIRSDQYKKTVNEYKNRKKEVIKFAVIVNILMASVIFAVGVMAVASN